MPPARVQRAEPADRLAAAHAHLVVAVEQLTTGAAWARMLTVAARFPTYSANNVLLIGIQRPDATRVAGIRAWNALGRRVRKGEKGIAILAPCLSRSKAGEAPAAVDLRSSGVIPRPGPADAEPARQLRGFRVAHVFDVAQTVGDPLPDVGPQLLHGAAPRLLTERLVEVIRSDGYTVERGPCAGGANGWTDFAARTVRVRDDVADAQAAKTLAHELGHTRADHETRFLARYGSSLGCRAQAEVEAESIAFLVAHAAGMASDAYSVPYLASWSGGDTALLQDAATRTIGVARGIVTDLCLERPGTGTQPPHPEHPWWRAPRSGSRPSVTDRADADARPLSTARARRPAVHRFPAALAGAARFPSTVLRSRADRGAQMNPEPIFTDPPVAVQQARVAMARAQRSLALHQHPLDPCCDLTGIGLAFLNLEALYPPYPPLIDVDPSDDPASDLTDALRFLGAAIAYADSAVDVARYAATIADLSDLELLAEDPGYDVGGYSTQWP